MAGDVDGFGALLGDHFVYLSERDQFDRRAYPANVAAGIVEVREFETGRSSSRIVGEVAIVTGEVRMTATFQGKGIGS